MSLTPKVDPFKYARADTTALINFANDQHRNVKEASYGALGNDTGNDAPAIHAAVNDVPGYGGVVYLPPGVYRLTSAIVFPTNRPVRLVGAGRQATVLHVPAGTTATPGVIHVRGNEFGSSVEHLQISFDQPDVTTVAGMTHFVPAIYAQNCPRFQVKDVRIVRAWDGIDMRGNSGGARLENVDMSAFNVGVNIDGSIDSVYIDKSHFWPFGLTTNQTTAIYASTTTYPINCARVDDLHLSNCLFNTGRFVRFYNSVNGACWVTMTSCTLDGSCGLTQETAGRISMAACSVGHGFVGNRCILLNGGTLDIAGSHFSTLVNDSIATVEVAAGVLTMSGCRLFGTNVNTTMLHVNGAAATATVSGCTFIRDPNVTYSSATIFQVQGRLTLIGCRTTDKGTGTGNFVQLLADDQHLIADNNFLGWGLALPATHTGISAHTNVAAIGAIQYARGGEQQMGCRVTRATSQSIPNGAITPIGFDTERLDVPGWHQAINNSRVTVPVAGWYKMSGTLEWTGNSAGARYAHIRINSGAEIAVQGGPVGGSAEVVINNVSTEYYLTAGDYVELCGSQTSGGALNVVVTGNRSPEFSVCRISA